MSKTIAIWCEKIKDRLDIISIVIGIIGFNIFSASSWIIGWYVSLNSTMQIAFFGILNMIWTLCIVVAFTEAPKREIINISPQTPPIAPPPAPAPLPTPVSTLTTPVSTSITTSNKDPETSKRE
jgi:hypothetical protein